MPFVRLGRFYPGVVAGILLLLMLGLGLGSMMGDTAIVDEVAHIPAAYSYLHYGDYRLNPEHPPLVKDLAGLPLQFMHLRFPDTQPAWTTQPNGEWDSGWNFLYHLGNNASAILFWARLPILLLAIGFGIVLYLVCRRRWGRAVALLALFFYTLSPTIIAHARYVTTDLGASAFIFIALVTFVRYIERPDRRNLVLLSLALAGAQLAKFSSILLFPFLGLVTLGLVIAWRRSDSWGLLLRRYTGGLIVAGAISLLWVWLYYVPHTINMPGEVQDRLIQHALSHSVIPNIVPLLTSLNDNAFLKPLVQYLLGLSMVFGRVAGGNVTYFNGVVQNGSFIGYFPELFVLKTQLAGLILGLVAAIVIATRALAHRPLNLGRRLTDSLRAHLLEWVLGTFAAFYFIVAVAGNLNLGIRHILPIYPPLFVLVAIGVVKLYRRLSSRQQRSYGTGGLALLLVWYAASTILAYPSYLSYFNELIGGPRNADRYYSDSSVDWGQDLKRLKAYVASHREIDHLAIDYFGGADVKYYFCSRKYDGGGQLIATSDGYNCTGSVYQEWHAQYGKYQGQYLAISETFLENDRYYAAYENRAGYEYLRAMTPFAKIGNSIELFKLY